MPVATDDAHDLVSAARDLVRIESPATVGLWARGAALLTRQALEAALDQLCLGDFLHDRELAGRVSVVWDGLSRACHVRVYELAPTVDELQLWMDCAWELADAVERECARR